VPPGAAPGGEFDVPKLFATSCGWCHLSGGRAPGKGPQLMGTTMTDAEIVSRIRNGKTGQMPAFGSTFNDDQLKAIVSYVRGLKP
jgi:mono/diheme cytochrome c family protein